MKLLYFSNEFPKEDLQHIFRRLHSHSKNERHTILAQFVHDATVAVKDEIRNLPAELRRLIPTFDSILSWAADTDLREGLICGAVDGALLVVAQIATYIGYVENHPEKRAGLDQISLAGLGIGLLAATAVSLSKAFVDLPLAGAAAVRLAFRMGCHVLAVSENLEPRDLAAPPQTWAFVIHNVDPVAVQQALDVLHSRENIPSTSRIFLSAVSRTSVTVSGPPSRLRALFTRSEFFRDSKSIALPVYGGLCHAPHVYGPEDIQSVVQGNLPHDKLGRLCPTAPIYSTSTGTPYTATSALELFECAVSELLTQAICWDQVIKGVVDRLRTTGERKATVSCFGNSIPVNDLKTSAEKALPHIEVSVNNLNSWVFETSLTAAAPRGSAQAKLAIVGMSCRLPGGAANTEKFWEVLEKGLDVSRRIPADRFDIDTHYDPTGKQMNKSMTQYGCFIDEPGMFDASFFNMSPREAQVADPQMRLALVTAFEALERAGYIGNRTPSTKLERIGTYYGQAADDYREVNQGQEVSTYYIPGGCRAFGPGRINYFFKFAGPSYSIDTACSSGLAAIEVACQALWHGDIDTAVAGGVNVLTNPDGFAGLGHGHFLTKGHNACKTWDATADGYCRADGVGSLVIKRLQDAEADNDNILGVILGAGTNHSAEAVSITHPHAGHQAYLARQVLRQADVDPLDVSYVELHGTGTQAGDYEEMKGIMDVYAPLVKRRSKDQPLHIGAVKANLGHGESVAGTTALIKVLLMLQKNAIPPHIGIKTEINPRFPKDFDKRNLNIAFEMKPWKPQPGTKRLVAINNFGAAGGNTTMILEEAPTRAIAERDHRPSHVVAVSAKSKVSLAGNIESLLSHLNAHSEISLADLSYTTTARRYHYRNRIAITTSDTAHLKSQLTSYLAKVDSLKAIPQSDPPPIAFTFTGQGASHKSMDLELYRDVPTFRDHIHHLDRLAQGQGFPSFVPALDGSHPVDHAHSPVVTQLALVCSEMALAKYWASLGVKPDIVLGHSLGEYAAMHVAGVTSAADTIFMVGRRAQLLQDKCTIGSHTMMAVRASLAKIAENSANKPYTIACVNTPLDTVLSGTKQQMDDIALELEKAGCRCIKLDVAFAFHSDQTDPILDDFEAIVKTGVVFQEPKVPIVSPLLGRVVFDDKTLNANYVRRATREAVKFSPALQNAQEVSAISDETIWIEIGPHGVCTNFIKSTVPSAFAVPSMRRGENNWSTMASAMAVLHLAGVTIDWNEFHHPFETRLRLLDLPTYSWNEKNFWLQYNGDWCLTKGNNFYQVENKAETERTSQRPQVISEILSSTVQQIIEEVINGSTGTVTMQSDLMQPDFLAAAHGHRMNDCGVVTSSIHADIAYTLGSYLYRKFYPNSKDVHIDIAELVVTKGLVAQSNKKIPQLIRVTAATTDIESRIVEMTWRNVDKAGQAGEPFATAKVIYGEASLWLSSWQSLSHLVQGRITALEQMAAAGQANRFSRNMAYTLFASNLVDYADKYRGMQSIVMHDLEAFADVQLTTKESGTWSVAPYFIDSVAHLAGFIMNCSDTMDTRNNYCVTPGWKSMRFAKPLTPGAQYRSYVKMIPTAADPTIFFGDVYIMQDNAIMGVVGGIQFRRYPRILLSRFFSPPDQTAEKAKASPFQQPKAVPAQAKSNATTPLPKPIHFPNEDILHPTAVPGPRKDIKASAVVPEVSETSTDSGLSSDDTIVSKALDLIANEGALDVADLEDDVRFADLGVDSLMSLVLAEKFRAELGIKVGGGLFVDYPTVGDLCKWLEEFYG
ncbi:Non-reducing polyketide synthase PKS8-1 [Cladophialophora chaetospira]|uniref:Non-reducing polyketide synthase PKS8-1 n=1 Tax=Cladophialophora chaetospira TaxID=386627 RepID=A0AA39CF42_9EURO|nr:Non-reducing polyketide synthase PKS8-1 [Cladophialophora chaetospira]